MNITRTITILAALVAVTTTTGLAHAGKKKPVTIEIETGGTIKVGDYETVCDKKPKECGSDYDPLGPRPKPKPTPTKLIIQNGADQAPAGYMMIGVRK